MGLEEKQIKILFDKFNGDSNKGTLISKNYEQKAQKSRKIIGLSIISF